MTISSKRWAVSAEILIRDLMRTPKPKLTPLLQVTLGLVRCGSHYLCGCVAVCCKDKASKTGSTAGNTLCS